MTNRGRVDLLYNSDDKISYFWEVKPGSYLRLDKMIKGMEQLSSYVDDSIVHLM